MGLSVLLTLFVIHFHRKKRKIVVDADFDFTAPGASAGGGALQRSPSLTEKAMQLLTQVVGRGC